jgi:uncharacterized membrane protein YhaH (DUF805 family)
MFTGRLSRLGFLLGFIYFFAPVVGIIFLYALTDLILGNIHPISTILSIIYYLFSVGWLALWLPVILGLYVRRWHDLGQSGWWVLLWLIPPANFFATLWLLITPCDMKPNKYGDPQLDNGFKAVLFGG